MDGPNLNWQAGCTVVVMMHWEGGDDYKPGGQMIIMHWQGCEES